MKDKLTERSQLKAEIKKLKKENKDLLKLLAKYRDVVLMEPENIGWERNE